MAQRETIEKLKGQNDFLKKEVLAGKADTQTMQGKLQTILNVKELQSEYSKIKAGTFFESKNSNQSTLQNNLGQSLDDQYKTHIKNTWVAKAAFTWLEKTREARQKREEEELYNF